MAPEPPPGEKPRRRREPCAVCDGTNEHMRLCRACRADPANTGWNPRTMLAEREWIDTPGDLAALPRDWYHHQRAPEHRIIFAHGSYLRNLSADDPEALRQGRVDWLLYNEGQKMRPQAIVNGLYGTADRAGLTMIAANPPSDPSQEWLLELKEAIEEDERFKRTSVFFHFSSKENPFIDQPARRDVEMIAKKIAPEAAEADAEGIWRRWGDMAYPAWNSRALDKGGLVGPVPKLGAVDVTEAVTRREFGRSYKLILGADFQKKPHEAAVVLRVFEDKDGRPIYWFCDETTVRGDEYELSASVVALGIMPGQALWIPDCSGSYQGSQRIPGRTSYAMLEEHGWHVEPAEIIRIPDKSEHPRNPEVGARLTLMLRLMEERRVRVDPQCDWLIECFAKCQLRRNEYGKRHPKGRHAHITDAACYPIWRLEAVKTAVPTRRGVASIDVRPKGGWQ